MIFARPVKSDDIRHVVYNLWERGQAEAQCFEIENKEALISYLERNSSEYGYALCDDGLGPVAVFGASEMEGTYYTWFIATDEFLKVAKQATIWLLRFVREQKALRPDERLELHSAVTHEDADRWFQLLGFQPIPCDALFSKYVYAPTK